MERPVETFGMICAGLLITLFGISCTATHATSTLGRGNWGIESTLGGPVTTSLGAPVPMPSLFAGVRYGLLDTLDVSTHVNLTAPVIPGIALDLQIAAHWMPIQPGVGRQADTPDQGWSVGGTLGVDWLTDFTSGATVMPYVEGVAGWRQHKVCPYLGTALAANFYRPLEQHDVPMISPFIGVEFVLGAHARFTLRGTVYDVTHNGYGGQAGWVYLAGDADKQTRYAPLGISFGFAWDGGKRSEKDG